MVRIRRAFLPFALAMLLPACSGDDGPAATDPPVSSAVETTTTTAAPDDPAALGDEIGGLYVAAYGDLIAVLADRPEAAAAVSLVAELKESYVRQFVALGHRREALDDTGRAAVDARIRSALAGLPQDTFDAYAAAAADYAGDPEVAALIADWSRVSESNRRPPVYKTGALPLS